MCKNMRRESMNMDFKNTLVLPTCNVPPRYHVTICRNEGSDAVLAFWHVRMGVGEPFVRSASAYLLRITQYIAM